MKKIALFVGLALFLASNASAVVTVNYSGNVIELTNLDADWSWTTTFPDAVGTKREYNHGIRVQTIIFYPSAANDILVLEEGSDTGPEIFPIKCADTYDQRAMPPLNGIRIKPVFDYTDSTIGTPANAKIVIILYKPERTGW